MIRQQSTGGDGSFGFVSATPELNFSITTAGGSGSSPAISLAAGSYAVRTSGSSDGRFALTGIACDDGDSNGDVASGTASIVLAAGETVTCTFTSFDAAVDTTAFMESFFTARGALILGNLPAGQRRIDRLNGVTPAPINPGAALMGYLPALSEGEAPPVLTTSLSAIEALTGAPTSRFDAWFQTTLGLFGSDGLSGGFGIVSGGADYLVDDNLLIGGFVQMDIIPNATTAAGGSAGGIGWLAGPYLTARLSDNLYLDLLGGAGTSSNRISPEGTYTDTFDATRWLASATLSGRFELDDNWTFSPAARVSWFTESSESDVDGRGIAIPAVTAGLGELAIGPRISHRMDLGNGIMVDTAVTLDGMLDVHTTATTATVDSLRGRIELSLDLTTICGASFGISAAYDGLGSSSTSNTSGSLRVLVPIR